MRKKTNRFQVFFFNPATPWLQAGQKPPNGARTKPHFQDQTVCAIDLGFQTPGEHDLDKLETSKGNRR